MLRVQALFPLGTFDWERAFIIRLRSEASSVKISCCSFSITKILHNGVPRPFPHPHERFNVQNHSVSQVIVFDFIVHKNPAQISGNTRKEQFIVLESFGIAFVDLTDLPLLFVIERKENVSYFLQIPHYTLEQTYLCCIWCGTFIHTIACINF